MQVLKSFSLTSHITGLHCTMQRGYKTAKTLDLKLAQAIFSLPYNKAGMSQQYQLFYSMKYVILLNFLVVSSIIELKSECS